MGIDRRSMTKRYLGDGAYYEFDGQNVILTAENGVAITDRIVLEPSLIVTLLKALTKDMDPEKMKQIIDRSKQ